MRQIAYLLNLQIKLTSEARQKVASSHLKKKDLNSISCLHAKIQASKKM